MRALHSYGAETWPGSILGFLESLAEDLRKSDSGLCHWKRCRASRSPQTNFILLHICFRFVTIWVQFCRHFTDGEVLLVTTITFTRQFCRVRLLTGDLVRFQGVVGRVLAMRRRRLGVRARNICLHTVSPHAFSTGALGLGRRRSQK
jgi:hypothetical protein